MQQCEVGSCVYVHVRVWAVVIVACIVVCIVRRCRVSLDDAEMVKARLRQHLLHVYRQVDACMDDSSRYMCCLAFVLQVLLPRVGVAQRGSVVVRVRIFVCLSVCVSLLRTS